MRVISMQWTRLAGCLMLQLHPLSFEPCVPTANQHSHLGRWRDVLSSSSGPILETCPLLLSPRSFRWKLQTPSPTSSKTTPWFLCSPIILNTPPMVLVILLTFFNCNCIEFKLYLQEKDWGREISRSLLNDHRRHWLPRPLAPAKSAKHLNQREDCRV